MIRNGKNMTRCLSCATPSMFHFVFPSPPIRNASIDASSPTARHLTLPFNNMPLFGAACTRPTVDRRYKRLMAALGLLIGRHPWPFLLIPLLISGSLVYPFFNGLRDYKRLAVTRAGAIELFTPVNSWAQDQKKLMDSYFKDGGYFSDRTVISPTLFILLVSAKDGGSVLRDEVAVEYARLRETLETLIFMVNNTFYDYKRLCAVDVERVKCTPDPYLLIWNLRKNGILRHVTYPIVNFSDMSTNGAVPLAAEYYIGPLFGGVDVDGAGHVTHAKYARMILNVPRKNFTEDLLGAFGRAFAEYVEGYKSDVLIVKYWASSKYIDDMQLISRRVIRLLPYLVGLLLLFALASCCMRDCVLSQPYLALCGVISACLGIQCGYALLFLFNVQLIEIAMIVPFLVLSIGVDDTFVMLNVWRHTNTGDDVATRLSHTYAEAAVSITITSITDVAAFLIGLSSVFPSVRIFCAYSACTLTTMFLFQISFMGACMVYAGRREAAGRHCVLFTKVAPSANSDGLLSRLFCFTSSPTSKQSHSKPAKPFLTLFFENQFSRCIIDGRVKIFIGATYAVYLGGAVYCLCAYLILGLQVSNLVPYDSVSHSYLVEYETYFTKCSTSAEIIITDKIPYEESEVHTGLLKMAAQFEHTEFTYKTDFWLSEFVQFAKNLRTPLDSDSFYRLLHDVFLQTPKYRKYAADMNLVCCTKPLQGRRLPYVNSSRFYVQLINMGYENRSRAMHSLRSIVDKQNLSLLVYDVSFPLAEQFDAILSGAVLDIVVGVGCMLIAALLFVPDTKTCACISFTVFSINVGVLGYMSILSIHLDIISLITVLLCIGFSVDYTAHVAYHYYTVDSEEVFEKVRQALGTVGGPILQSSLSMLIGVLTVNGVRAYIADTFVVTVCLVMVIGVYHALLVLPVMLSLVSTSKCREPSVGSEYVKPDPMLKFRFAQMQRQSRTQSWTQARRLHNDYKSRPLDLATVSGMVDNLCLYENVESLGSKIVEGDQSRRRELILGDTTWLAEWMHGDMSCSGEKGKYCAYCQMTTEIVQLYELSNTHQPPIKLKTRRSAFI